MHHTYTATLLHIKTQLPGVVSLLPWCLVNIGSRLWDKVTKKLDA